MASLTSGAQTAISTFQTRSGVASRWRRSVSSPGTASARRLLDRGAKDRHLPRRVGIRVLALPRRGERRLPGSLIPLEVYEIARRLDGLRITVCLLNVAIVWYLARRLISWPLLSRLVTPLR